MNPFDWIETATSQLESTHLLRRLVDRAGPQGATVEVGGKSLINFGSNDYLGLANHPEVTAAAQKAIDQYGWGSGASPLILGHSAAHQALERRLATREQTEAAVVFPTGYAANVGTIVALAGEGDAIFSDAKNHASIIDGCRLSAASVHVYPHNDTNALDELLQHTDVQRRKLIVTDALFSMDGDMAKLIELVAIATAHGAMLLVDEAHATGVIGPHGRGVCELAGVESYAGLIRTGTLSKSLGALGGFAVGTRTQMDWLVNRCRSYIFSTAAPPANCAAAMAAIDVEQKEPQRRAQLMSLSAQLRSSLTDLGLDIGSSTSQIIPVFIGDARRTMQMAEALRHQGMFVPGIRPPSVPDGESLLRISLTSEHSDEMIDELVSGLKALSDDSQMSS